MRAGPGMESALLAHPTRIPGTSTARFDEGVLDFLQAAASRQAVALWAVVPVCGDVDGSAGIDIGLSGRAWAGSLCRCDAARRRIAVAAGGSRPSTTDGKKSARAPGGLTTGVEQGWRAGNDCDAWGLQGLRRLDRVEDRGRGSIAAIVGARHSRPFADDEKAARRAHFDIGSIGSCGSQPKADA